VVKHPEQAVEQVAPHSGIAVRSPACSRRS
jgi:hypothetical protein